MDRVRVRLDEDARWLVLERGSVTVACNLAMQDQTVPLPEQKPPRVLLRSEPEITVNAAGVIMPAESLVILSAEEP
jgi:maltooligosyltrehalose trehalohydrolase